MEWPKPLYSRSQVNKAGDILVNNINSSDLVWAFTVLTNWRSCHGYPINTFQATLRAKLKSIDKFALVAQRLKRIPSIYNKLHRFPSMKLSRMQDIGGLRAVLSDILKVRVLESEYKKSIFKHQLVDDKDYIVNPKSSGYRGIHLVYRYKNKNAPGYDGLLLEIQLRTRIQHAWATAVETMGIFLDHALKSSEGPKLWLEYFSLTGSAFARLENCPPVGIYEHYADHDLYDMVVDKTIELDVIDRLSAFSVAVHKITSGKNTASYHLVILDPKRKTVKIQSFGRNKIDEANEEYTNMEKKITSGEPLQVVLVSAGPIEALKRAYPNYFLDTHEFISYHFCPVKKRPTSRMCYRD